jgi:hypothetical protein
MHKHISSENPKKQDHLEDLGVDRRIILKRVLNKVCRMGIEFIWLRTESSSGFLRT